MSELSEILERFRRGPELVATVMTGAAGAELDFVPAADKWSIRQIICHLADAELVGSDRLRRTIAEDNPTLLAYDQDAWARNLNYARRKTSEALETFRRLRADNYELIKDLPESAYARTATHSENGPMTLLQTVRGYAVHAEAHARQLRAVREAYKEARSQKTEVRSQEG